MRERYGLKPGVGQEIPISVLGIVSRDETLWIAEKPLPLESFPPCIKNILAGTGPTQGRHRALATLAAFLGQSGLKEDEARAIWKEVASQAKVSEKIFDSWYRKLHCPKCDTIRRKSRGYPNLGMKNLRYCQPQEKCKSYSSPIENAAGDSLGASQVVKTTHLAMIFYWDSCKEEYIELSEDEALELSTLVRSKPESSFLLTGEKVGARIRPKFVLLEEAKLKRKILSELL